MPVMGPKGQIVITKEIRDRLGIGPGWLAIERVVDDHVEIYFVPPKHRRSLLGVLKPASDPFEGLTDDERHEAEDRAVAEGIATEWRKTAARIAEDSAT